MQGFVFSLAHRFFSNFRIIENTLCSLKPHRKNFNKHASDVWKLLLTFWCLFTLQLEKKVVELGKKNSTLPLNTEDSGSRSSHHVIRVPSALRVSVELICVHF